jgi:hypothetical protein
MTKNPAKQQDVLVPYAKDGTCFSPALRKVEAGTFTVGSKGNELTFADYDEALDYLRRMPTARWRRQNSAGNWGLAAAVRWGSLC